MRQQRTGRLATFIVVFLLVMLPVSTSAQLSGVSSVNVAEEQPQQLAVEAGYKLQGESAVEPQIFCWPNKECNNKCWTNCPSGYAWYCASSGGVCCSSGSKFCDSSAGKCWTDNCPAGTKWTCTSTGAKCESICDNPSYPNYCGGSCWSNCGSGYTWKCKSDGTAECVLNCADNDGDGYGSGCSNGFDCNDNDANINPGKSEACGDGKDNDCDGSADEGCCAGNRGCGSKCWTACPGGQIWNCGSDGKAYCTTPCTDNDGDGYGSGCSKGSDCNDNNVNINPGKSEVCGNGIDDNCNGQADESCCPADNPYFCSRTGNNCWLNKERCDTAINCGGQWRACDDPARNEKCVDGKVGCCLPQHPYFCPSNNYCFGQDGFCDGRNVYTCGTKSSICNTKSDVGQCFGDTLRCCPPGESWWESDKQCHRSSEPQKCTVPDGSSANCDCDSDSDCSASSGKPYCGEGGSLYDVRTPQGFHACLSSKPEFCGNGKCGGSENYNNCQTDCGQLAPKGTINVDVYYSSGANANKPISGASVSLDGVQKGTTDSRGKLSLQASYGQRNVRVECPDNTFCGEKTVGVDSIEYVGFGCDCKLPVSFSNLRARFKAKTNAYPKGYPVANVDVLIDNSLKGASNQFGAVDVEGLTTGAHQIDVYLKLLEDRQEKIYTGGTSLTLSSSYEEKVYVLVKGNSPSATYMALESGKEAFALYEANVTPEILWIPIILAVVWIAGTAWDAYDYKKCVERQATAWDPNKEDWSKFECNNEMDEEQLNDCVNKLLSKNQNTIERCEFQTAMLAANFIPVESYLKTGGKLAVTIGKKARFIPFIDDAFGGGYKIYKATIGSEAFVKIADKTSEYAFKLVDNSLRITGNIAQFIVKKIVTKTDVLKRITNNIEGLLKGVKPKDVPKDALDNLPEHARPGQVKGYLGEKAADEYVDVIKTELKANGDNVVKYGEKFGKVTETNNYVIKLKDDGNLEIFYKVGGKQGSTAGEIDRLVFINDKPIIIEAKTTHAARIAEALNKQISGAANRKIAAIEELTGTKPEFLVLIPKSESNNFAFKNAMNKFTQHTGEQGAKSAYDEFPVTSGEFEDAARRVANEFKKFGRE